MAEISTKRGKTVGIVIAVIVVAGLIYAFSRGGQQGAAPSGGTSSGGSGTDALLASCTPGTFSGESVRLTINVTVKEKIDVGCVLEASIAVSEGAGLFDPYDKNGDGRLPMECTVPLAIDTFSQLTEYLKGPGLQGCEGEYRDLLDSFGS